MRYYSHPSFCYWGKMSKQVPVGIDLRVAKRNETITNKKHRDYPWSNIGTFLASTKCAEKAFCTIGNGIQIHMRLQNEIAKFARGEESKYLKVLPRPPINGFEDNVLTRETFLTEISDSIEYYDTCHEQRSAHEFYDSYEYTAKRRNCLSLWLDITDIVTDAVIYLMLRPFIFPHQGEVPMFGAPIRRAHEEDDGLGLYHSGSMLLVEPADKNGLFYQLKWRFTY